MADVPSSANGPFWWLATGDEAFARMLQAIAHARTCIRFEFYILTDSPLARRFRDAFVAAAQRGVRVRVLLDGLGSRGLPEDYWADLQRTGGEFLWFNPWRLHRLAIRNHRKLLAVDDTVAFIGGRNIASEYEGDGVTQGWRDLGLELTGPSVAALAATFDHMFAHADRLPLRFARLRRAEEFPAAKVATDVQVLAGRPGRTASPLKRSLMQDLARARRVRIVSAYFFPPLKLRRVLARVARKGGQVQLITSGKTDVMVAQLAAQNLYQRLLRARVEIHEYQPQVLHTKLFLIDDAVYAGSANLDIRSLHINYELLVRLTDPGVVAEAQAIFEDHLTHSRRIDPKTWRQSRSLWRKLRERYAAFVISRLDPYVARWVAQSPR